jgi:hypothetical protein
MVEEKEFYQGRVVVPDDDELKRWVLQQYHDHQLAGHPGITNTTTAVMQEFWWPEVWKFATAYVWGCVICQSTKASTMHLKPPILSITPLERQNPFQMISIDLITDLPVSEGYDSILTVVNQGCSKAAVFLLCQKTINVLGIATLYAQRIFPFFGIPQWVISDRDPRFTAKFIVDLCTILKIDQNLSTAYHPQMDGQSERANQRVEQYLRISSNDEKSDWVSLLPMVQYTHNTTWNESI